MKPIMKKSLIAISVALAVSACQNLEQEKASTEDARKEKVGKVNPEKDRESLDELLSELRNRERAQKQSNKSIESRPANAPPEQSVVVTTGSRFKRSELESAAPILLSDRAYVVTQEAPAYNNEKYQELNDNKIKLVKESPVSTFSIDVDTASYSNVRRMLNDGYLPPKDAVRLEEFVNYFDYDFESSDDLNTPFAVNTSVMNAPWNKDAKLIQIGIKGFEPEHKELPASNLVFLVDVSGSMQSPNKLGLVKKSLKLLTKQLTENDKVSLVVYAGASGVVLEPTGGNNKLAIEQALDQLTAGGSTNGASGIKLAYQMAQKGFIKDGINRVILATDGDFNVGMTNHDDLIQLIEQKRKTNIFFSSLGFGTGNYNEHLMEQLANKGNGNAAYIDSLHEAKKVLVDERAGTLMTIAKDVKIQVEFNPQIVSEYRLLGYENRLLNREDFNNDKIDAGEIGAGHTVTALYEVVLQGSKGKRVDPLRYQQESIENTSDRRLALEAAMVKLRYKSPLADKSRLIEKPIFASAFGQHNADDNIRFAASSAAFAQLLRGNTNLGNWSWSDAIEVARKAKGNDPKGYRSEMIKLMEMAQLLSDESTNKSQKVGMLEQ